MYKLSTFDFQNQLIQSPLGLRGGFYNFISKAQMLFKTSPMLVDQKKANDFYRRPYHIYICP